MSLRFLGDWNPWIGALAALALAAIAVGVYRRETRPRGGGLAWVLPSLRAAVVLLAVLMLTGPVLHHRKVLGERGRVLVFVDASRSMGLDDAPMEASRKLLAAHRLGWIPADALDARLAEAADALGRARRAPPASGPGELRDSFRGLAREVESAFAHLSRVRPDTGGVALERKGIVLREFWTGVPGGAVADLARAPGFPARPEGVSMPAEFEAPVNWADHYGTRMRGFVHPPVTGNYTFWIAGDEQAELWLSPDADPARKALVARALRWTEPRGWDQTPGQKSAPQRLEAGKKYYVEALQKEATGGDGLAVGWQLPDGKMERPIPGSRLSAPTTSAESPAKALDSMIARFREELLAPAQALAERGREADPAKSAALLSSLRAGAAAWEKELREAFANYANRVAAQPGPAVDGALRKFDALPRWKRAEAMLLGGERGFLARLAERHHVELLALADGEARLLWATGRDEAAAGLPKALSLEPSAATTNLSDGLQARVGGRVEESMAAVLLSDGQHNAGGSPLAAAKVLGNRQVPVHAVGLGSPSLPNDLAVLEVKAPLSVFHKDRVRGELVLKDDMPAGRPFTVRIESGGRVVWERELATERSRIRRIPFDFPVQELVGTAGSGAAPGVEVLHRPLSFQASVSLVEGEREARNNDASFDLHAIMQRRKVLILDGRPRWETRYLRNLFERDEQWEVNAVLADRGTEGWIRGPGPGRFPPDRASLYAYDFVVLGEVPRPVFRLEELEWIRDFVGKRGAGLLLVDGRRGHLSGLADTPFGPLIPVDWKSDPARPTGLRLTPQGASRKWLELAPDPARNQELWGRLAAPHWVAPARALSGAETLVEAVAGDRKVPALVYRRFGAGRVLYSGFDETWRWRYEVADLHHQRYWNQVVRELMEPPFTVRDDRVSLSVDRLVYGPKDRPAFRVRLRDAEGKPVLRGDAEVLVHRDGKKLAAIRLDADPEAGGLHLGLSDPLPAGRYEVRVRAAGLQAESRARTEFVVKPPESGELAQLHLNEELLRQVASASGGEFFREEDLEGLQARLEPLNRERVFESDTVLWQSWWWFLPIVGLLTAEWAFRKWAGML